MEIPLNIVKSYPVSWDTYKIFRDFIQNFYDSVGYEKWHNALHYEYANSTLVMWVDDINFSYEWLLHIGASTKTNAKNTAGYFGEGFKIASLCAVRDNDYGIKMESADWVLAVRFVTHSIDNQEVEMMVYDVDKTSEKLEKSRLTITNVSEADCKVFETALLSFYYPENPLIGDLIWQSETCAVHYRSSKPIPASLPYISDFGRKGAVFCCYQMLGTNPFNLVICLHDFRKDDRERSALYRFEVVDIFETIARKVSSEGAFLILEKMRRYWNSLPKKNIDIYSWSDAVDNLIYRLASDPLVLQKFREKYPHLLCLPKISTRRETNDRHTALEWLKSREQDKYLLVKGSFRRLGYETLEDYCRRNGGFIEDEDVRDERENKCFMILNSLIDKIYLGFFILDFKPTMKIITNNSAIFHGMATTSKKYVIKKNKYGLKVRNNIHEIYLKRIALTKSRFYDALSTYIHELCHMFGSDASQSFSQALTDAMTILLENVSEIEKSHQEWLDNFNES